MLEAKTLEIRDEMTFIPVVAIRVNGTPYPGMTESDRYLIRRSGYAHEDYILLARLSADGAPLHYDPFSWPGVARTMRVAHEWIREHWTELESGAVVDVEFALGITAKPKTSEQREAPL